MQINVEAFNIIRSLKIERLLFMPQQMCYQENEILLLWHIDTLRLKSGVASDKTVMSKIEKKPTSFILFSNQLWLLKC